MYRFSIDRGGTFTDVFAQLPDGSVTTMKLLSVDPENYDDAPSEAIRRIMGVKRGTLIPVENICFIRMASTIATNALLERTGEPTLFVTTKGFRDVLEIGSQTRVDIFDLKQRKAQVAYCAVLEVDERVVVREGGSAVTVERAPQEAAVREQLTRHFEAGLRSVSICLLHSYAFDEHELLVERIAREVGFPHISTSSRLIKMVKLIPRATTTTVDGYLTPLIAEYIRKFRVCFEEGPLDLTFMMSDGGLCSTERFSGFKAVLSGPAGGVVGYAHTAYDGSMPVIGFDMGGTSTDCSRFDGDFQHAYNASINGITLLAPQLDIVTVASGGGSRLFYRSGLMVVGPESAGAHPGPLCYRMGGYLTVTDANVFLGRVVPSAFPSIFGANRDEPLDVEASAAAFHALEEEMGMEAREIALGFIRVANESMSRPIRNLTEGRGLSASKHSLAVFGGAGGQHACAIARALGIRNVLIHRYASILSAYGVGLADVVEEAQEPVARLPIEDEVPPGVQQMLGALEQRVTAKLSEQNFGADHIRIHRFLHLRYEGTDTALMIEEPSASAGTFKQRFCEAHLREFGFTMSRRVLVDDARVRGRGLSEHSSLPSLQPATESLPAPASLQKCCFKAGESLDTPVYTLDSLGAGAVIFGPALLVDLTNTVLVEPGCRAEISGDGSIRISVGEEQRSPTSSALDTTLLSVFANRFMSIAEQMGRGLQRTAVSTNIKERLDFSCALFSSSGGLVANAPHIPVHLGSMQSAIRYQLETLGAEWREGDVLMTNHPSAGGTHLPDITVISSVWSGGRPVFYVASRGHHADIGGLTPGSMPPNSRCLADEGAAVMCFKLVRGGHFDEQGVSELLKDSRKLSDNLSDLKAQVAANQKGVQLTLALIEEYGLECVLAYMQYVQDNCERAVRDLLMGISSDHNQPLTATDYMDDGSRIQLTVTINGEDGSAVFDFSGTACQTLGNVNAPRAITSSAIIYCLRCMVSTDIPLNEGCLAPIRIIIPQHSLLSPGPEAAVVGGNVLTSQRITDVILEAFGAASNSSGDTSNLTFGDSTFGYYETIPGGAGAGPGWSGTSGVQTHMTNTAGTDTELLELRYPVKVRSYSIRRGSGGQGEFPGGDGTSRVIEFLRPATVGILSERRSLAPKGLSGGGDGERGVNLALFASGRSVSLGPKNSIALKAGDAIRIDTPGGGAWGAPRK